MEPINPFITVLCAVFSFLGGMFLMTIAQSCQ